MKNIPTINISNALSFEFENFGALPKSLICGKDISYYLRHNDEKAKSFFHNFIQCVFEKEQIKSLKIILTKQQFEIFSFSKDFIEKHHIEKIDNIYHIIIEKEYRE